MNKAVNRLIRPRWSNTATSRPVMMSAPEPSRIALRDHQVTHLGGAAALLTGCLDELVAVGRLPPSRRPRTEVAVWAAVHGLALPLTDRTLRTLPPAEREQVISRTLDVVGAGI